MSRTKEAVVCVLDVSKSMKSGTPTRIESALKAVEMLVRQKLLLKPKDEVGIVLFGSEDTENDLNVDTGEYEHVQVYSDLDVATLDLMKEIPNITASDCDGDLIDGLMVALDLLHKRTQGKKYTKRLFLVTDGGSPVNGTDDLEPVLASLEALSCTMSVIGVDFAAKEKAAVKAENEKLIHSIAEDPRVGGEVVSASRAVEMMGCVARSVAQVTKFRGDLEIGGQLRIPMWSYAQTMECKLPSLKKLSAVSPDADSGDPKAAMVKMDRVYHSQEDPDRELEEDERVKAYRYGKQQVPFDKVDADSLKLRTEKCLKLIGFVPADTISRAYYMSTTDCIVAKPGDDNAAVAASALIHALQDSRKVAVVRYVKRANGAPALGFLAPHVSEEVECLFWNQLPFAEDLREYTFPPLDSNAAHVPTYDQLSAAGDLIDSLMLTPSDADTATPAASAGDGDGDGEEKGSGAAIPAPGTGELLVPTSTFNPVLQRFRQCLVARALSPGCPLPPLDPIIAQTTQPDPAIFEAAAPARARFAREFTFTKTESSSKGKRRFWGDIDTQSASAASADNTKKFKAGDGDGEMKLADIMDDAGSGSGAVSRVGHATPVADFQAMLSNRTGGDLTEAAVKQMRVQIEKFVRGGPTFHDKALRCLQALREGCLENLEVEAFNQFASALKEEHQGGAHEAFWDKMVSAGVSLIDNEESPDGVTAEKKREFLSQPSQPSAAVTLPAEEEEEDLFDDFD